MSLSFARLVAATMERVAPLRLAESWDNVGLLLESPPKLKKASTRKILLTIDLTPPVANEAIGKDIDVVISYHPPIFRPLSTLTLSDPIQTSLLRLTQAGTSVFSPHTALDSVTGGINDWLCSAFTKSEGTQHQRAVTRFILDKGDERGGAGRIVSLPEPGMTIHQVVTRVKDLLGQDTPVQVAQPYETANLKSIQSIAVCAGSGGSMFKDVDADVYFTGEMTHHEILAAVGRNRYVVLCGHTNTERGFLRTLRDVLKLDQDLQDVSIEISEKDAHPLHIYQ